MPLAEPAEVDATVSLASVTDRLAREGSASRTLPLPPTTVSVGWAAMAPPRSGWERVGAVTAEEVYAVAREGIAEVACRCPGRRRWPGGDRPAAARLGPAHDHHPAGPREAVRSRHTSSASPPRAPR